MLLRDSAHVTNYHLSSVSTLTYDTTHRLSDSTRFSVDVSDSLSSSGRRSPLLSSRDGDGVIVSALRGVVVELARVQHSACCAAELDLGVLADPRTASEDVVEYFCSSKMWHCTACRNGR